MSFVSCIETIRKKADSFDAFLAALDPDVRALAISYPASNEWLPLRVIQLEVRTFDAKQRFFELQWRNTLLTSAPF